MPNLLSSFTWQKVAGAATPSRLQQYFHGQGLLTDIADFEQLKKEKKAEAYKQHIADSIPDLGEAAGNVDNDFRKIYVLSKEKALLALIAHMRQVSAYKYLLDGLEIEGIERECDKILYFLGNEPEFISEFYLLYSLNAHSESYWNRRNTDIIFRDKDITKEEVDNLREAIKEELKVLTHGKNCEIKHVCYEGKDHLFAIAENMPITIPQWKNGQHCDVLTKPSFDVAFVYDRELGELDICCNKGAKFRNKMQLAFSKAVLGQEIQELKKDDEVYNLPLVMNQLITNRRVDFCTNSSKNVNDIFIRGLRLQGTFYRKDRIVLDTGQKERISSNQDDIYTSLEDYLKMRETSKNTVNINEFSLAWIECIVHFYNELTKEDGTKRFRISGNSGCNLGFEGIDKEIRECLKTANIQLENKTGKEVEIPDFAVALRAICNSIENAAANDNRPVVPYSTYKSWPVEVLGAAEKFGILRKERSKKLERLPCDCGSGKFVDIEYNDAKPFIHCLDCDNIKSVEPVELEYYETASTQLANFLCECLDDIDTPKVVVEGKAYFVGEVESDVLVYLVLGKEGVLDRLKVCETDSKGQEFAVLTTSEHENIPAKYTMLPLYSQKLFSKNSFKKDCITKLFAKNLQNQEAAHVKWRVDPRAKQQIILQNYLASNMDSEDLKYLNHKEIAEKVEQIPSLCEYRTKAGKVGKLADSTVLQIIKKNLDSRGERFRIFGTKEYNSDRHTWYNAA